MMVKSMKNPMISSTILYSLAVSQIMQAAAFTVTLPSSSSSVIVPDQKLTNQKNHGHNSELSSSSSSDMEIDHTDSQTTNKPKNICILGGGFGGLNTALTLASLPWSSSPNESDSEQMNERPTITLVDKKERFVFLPLLYELCVGDAELEEVAPTFKSLLQDTDINFIQADINGIDADNKIVYTSTIDDDTKNTIPYDSLVVATGADVNLSSTPGAESYAVPFYTIEDCFELRKRLNLLDAAAAVVDDTKKNNVVDIAVVGGGYSGVELALNVMERLKKTYSEVNLALIHRGDEVLQYATEYNQKVGVERLEKAGVKIMTKTSVLEVLPDKSSDEEKEFNYLENKKCQVVLQSKAEEESLDVDLLLWTAGATSTNVQSGVLNSKLPRDNKGRIVTNSQLQVKGFENIFALGDRARVKKIPYGATAQVAMQQAPFVAWNMYVSLTKDEDTKKKGSQSTDDGLKPVPFSYLNAGEMMTLGEEDATMSALNGLFQLSGPGASVLRRLIYVARQPTTAQALTAFTSSAERRLSSVLQRKNSSKTVGKSVTSKKNINWN